jgi:hypothetical protein
MIRGAAAGQDWSKPMGLFRRFRRMSGRGASGGIHTVASGDTGLVTVDLDSFGPDVRKDLLEDVAKINACHFSEARSSTDSPDGSSV